MTEPNDVVSAILDTHHAIVGSSGGGKTVTGKGEVEELLRQHRHLTVIDPTGVWYGLRSNVAGDGPGFDIPIFGGPHGDVAISPADGDAIARLIIEQGVSAIVDLSAMHDDADQRAFMAPFVHRLRAKPRGNFHLIVDEADEACPQTAPDDVAFALTRDMVWIAKRGRVAGFVLTLITQRPADISKAVLSQMQTIVAHQLVDPRDQGAIDAYLKAQGDKATRERVMSSLPSLATGERWVYSPRLGLLERGRSPALTTFDSSRTPAPGEIRVEPKMLGGIDLSAIAAALKKPALPDDTIPADPAAAYEKGGAVGPMIAERDARIAWLEARVAELETENAHVGDELSGTVADLDRTHELVTGIFEGRMAADAARAQKTEPKRASAGDAGGEGMSPATSTSGAGRAARSGIGRGAGPAAEEASTASAVGASNLPPAQQNILDKLAWACEAFHKLAIDRQVLAIVLGVHPRTKGFLNNLGALRSAGLIDYPDGKGVALTTAGAARAARPSISGAPLKILREQICKWLPMAQARILRLTIDSFPNAIARDRLAELLNLHPRTKGFLNNLGRLRTLGLLTGTPAQVRAAAYLFGKD